MKHTHLTAILCQLLIGLNVVFCGRIIRETGCPPPEDIVPCKCFNSSNAYLICENILNADELRWAFQNSERYTYLSVYLHHSTIQYLPHDMFEYTPVISLYLKNVTMIQLFDSPPESLHMLDTLVIDNSKVLSRITWDLLEPLTELRVLDIYFNDIKRIDSDFSQYVSKNLQQITFYATKTTRINPGVLTEFPKLDSIAIYQCKLTELSRDMFAVPFNGRFLHFDDNKITSIPNDLFTQMPNLQTVSLRNNLIASIPESAFEGNIARITYVWFDGNPLKCDCLLQWITRNKPKELSGSCSSPTHLQGRELKYLSPNDFNC